MLAQPRQDRSDEVLHTVFNEYAVHNGCDINWGRTKWGLYAIAMSVGLSVRSFVCHQRVMIAHWPDWPATWCWRPRATAALLGKSACQWRRSHRPFAPHWLYLLAQLKRQGLDLSAYCAGLCFNAIIANKILYAFFMLPQPMLHWRHCFCLVRRVFCPVFRPVPNIFFRFARILNGFQWNSVEWR